MKKKTRRQRSDTPYPSGLKVLRCILPTAVPDSYHVLLKIDHDVGGFDLVQD